MGVEIDEVTKTARIVLDKVEEKKVNKFVISLWDNDIYILEGYSSVQEILDKIAGMEWVSMPNGARVKQSAIAKVQTIEDYRFQVDQKSRHKKGQYIGGKKDDTWYDLSGEIEKADIKSITGTINTLPRLTTPQQNSLPKASTES